MKRWRCSVCGYVHKGDEPPEKCPVCGAARSKFVELIPEAVPSAEPDRSAPPREVNTTKMSGFYDLLTDLLSKHHVHPISVHIPNGVAPVAVTFMALAVFFELESLASAAFYNMVFVALCMPLVLFSGYIDWQKRFGGNLTRLFIVKLVCGLVVLLSSIFLVFWRIIDPEIAAPTSTNRWTFLLVHLILLCAAALAGFCGGKLVFDRN
ncbi:MAG: rubredoxin-like domain-containing protein [Pseudomonadota bacterium]|uniref:Rubredoxin-like domain-containing protein n=1 Tax=Candidatus Desulfatibia profunda TaxID=2841695 RepID=A0A8J6TNL1_9BACT|nr:hypothetical protein [Candidatus Desulfatibia profunda]MBL7179992.1 hypothetical protein [Desulfobacterales bacterium]MBU0698950.1 hypothetical protein [Pseudomonadota bacterium]